MIARLTGRVESREEGRCVVDVNGVGYLVHASTRTLAALPSPPEPARLWIETGDKVSVRSRVGRIETVARVTDRIEPGHVFTAFHFPEVRTNLLVGHSADVNTSCPEYKVVAVDVRPVPEAVARTPALATH